MSVHIKLSNACVDFDLDNAFLKKSKKYRALDNINLELFEGDRLGLIGHNGAGKSTLLKLMAGIYPATSGVCTTEGRICPMFELATGFEMELTGWQNIKIRGMLLGMEPEYISSKLDDIADFCELGEFLNQPVKTYSTGMFMRLAFAVSTSFEPEILLLDEVVGTGDASFYLKAKKRMDDFISQGKLLVFTSHSLDLIKYYCNKVAIISSGTIAYLGEPNEAIDIYLDSVRGPK
ncbi:ABC transporter ATP-binding protein [Enterovibrio baiacu]|uniref:ABC transporter ATP-binding protein n=1 Tax=Enterovibrio baiacu TaxID=2491023 RepID=UPI003D11FE45